ncbi:hypothetical protein SKAU_G00363200 [Synaphobranchus kaupii]|uniref:Uncharacterized protein n=1 Tax=Synaphobranchus kaupii TaxID=118154 RepID=A0A9Q1EIQ5_SYNKA|nr:hypothetical protein SKAU_G00363200 [Synaphobranchus kaupii]
MQRGSDALGPTLRYDRTVSVHWPKPQMTKKLSRSTQQQPGQDKGGQSRKSETRRPLSDCPDGVRGKGQVWFSGAFPKLGSEVRGRVRSNGRSSGGGAAPSSRFGRSPTFDPLRPIAGPCGSAGIRADAGKTEFPRKLAGVPAAHQEEKRPIGKRRIAGGCGYFQGRVPDSLSLCSATAGLLEGARVCSRLQL